MVGKVLLLCFFSNITNALTKEIVTYQESLKTENNVTKTKESHMAVQLNATMSSIEFQFGEEGGSFKSWVVFYEKVSVIMYVFILTF